MPYFALKTTKKKLPLHDLSIVKATAPLSLIHGLYGAAGNFAPRIAGRLRGEIVRFVMHNDGSTNDVGKGKAFCIIQHPSKALIAE